MKITKRQLKRIIKEEKTRLLKEYRQPDDNRLPMYAGEGPEDQAGLYDILGGADAWYDDIEELIYKKLIAGEAGLNSDGESLVAALENLTRSIKDQMRRREF